MFFQHLQVVFERNRLGVKISLCIVTAFLDKEVYLLLRFYAFGYRLQVQHVGKLDGGLDHMLHFGLTDDALNEATVQSSISRNINSTTLIRTSTKPHRNNLERRFRPSSLLMFFTVLHSNLLCCQGRGAVGNIIWYELVE